MHIDLNSCFASIEQQANPLLRGRPVAVAAYTTPSGCILAPSVEAKVQGVKVGMRVREGQLLCPDLIVLGTDPWKYRHVHIKLKNLLNQYTNVVIPKSIDEFIIDLEGFPGFAKGMEVVALEIKQRIKSEIGDWLTVSIGIGPNRFLAKIASNLKKPDGLNTIDVFNFQEIYQKLSLPDLHGIDRNLTARLNSVSIYSVMDFYNASISHIKSALHSVTAYYWYLRLRGWEIDDVELGRKSFGHMYSLPVSASTPQDLSPILHKLVQKLGSRMRKTGYRARGIHVAILYKNHSFWHQGTTLDRDLFDSIDIYKRAFKILLKSPYRFPVANLSVSCFNLSRDPSLQLDLFGDINKKSHLTSALDKINEKWGDFIITPARMIDTSGLVPDRISFGGVKDLEQFVFGNS
ncbi:MAG: DNA polymerase Y family protein [Patescibacteria group bacterium]